ncbi:MAG TPA: NAD(P)H-dependent oxidoreductase subunit E [Kineosporiaceae bacterium]
MNASQGSIATRPGEPGDERLALVNRYLRRVGYEQDQLIQTLHVAQEVFGYLSEDVLRHVAEALRLPESRVFGVATFYHLFNLDPPGDHSCTVCTGTACFVKGAEAIVTALSEEFGIVPGQTTPGRSLTLGTTRCLGSCGLAPMVVLDGEVHSHQDAASALAAVRAALAAVEQV